MDTLEKTIEIGDVWAPGEHVKILGISANETNCFVRYEMREGAAEEDVAEWEDIEVEVIDGWLMAFAIPIHEWPSRVDFGGFGYVGCDEMGALPCRFDWDDGGYHLVHPTHVRRLLNAL